MTVEITEPALSELNEAVDHYNLQSHGLGDDFFDDVYKTISLIQKFPDAWSKCSKRTRKAILKEISLQLNLSYNQRQNIHNCDCPPTS